MLVLSIIQGPDKGRTFELPDDEPQLVGRSSEALPLTDNTVSRRHAEMTPDSGDWYVRDLGSQNGTWVNGVRIDGRTKLKPGDQIRAGATLLIFGRSAGAPATSAVRITKETGPDRFDRTLPSNEDSVIMSSPDPRQGAADHLRVIYKLTTLTTQIPDRQHLLEGVMDLVFTELKPERGCIMLLDHPSGMSDAERPRPEDMVAKPRPAVVRYAIEPVREAGMPEPEMEISRSLLQHALLKGEGVLLGGGRSGTSTTGKPGSFKAGDSVMQLSIRSALCSPIRFRDRTFGAIYVDSSLASSAFYADQLALLNAIGQHTGLALANAELYQQKLHAERLAAMGETVASLSHSVKNILQGLRGGADVVEMGLKKDDMKVARGGWGILKRNLDRIMELTMNMLAYSRPRTLEMELVKLGPLLEDCASLLRDRATAKNIALIVDVDPELPPVPMDAGQMHQALMNLLTNAVEAVESNVGTVTVRATFESAEGPGAKMVAAVGQTHITVIDNGPGIAPEMFQKVFEPFFTTKGLRGTGLGLAVTKRIAELHGGSVSLESTPGKGTAFTLHIPVDLAGGLDPSQTAASRSMNAGSIWTGRLLDNQIDPRQL